MSTFAILEVIDASSGNDVELGDFLGVVVLVSSLTIAGEHVRRGHLALDEIEPRYPPDSVDSITAAAFATSRPAMSSPEPDAAGIRI